MILLIDNYDSFSYNLVQMAGSIQPDIRVVRNDAATVEEVFEMRPSHIILSPGPGYPKDAGICEELVKKAEGRNTDSRRVPRASGNLRSLWSEDYPCETFDARKAESYPDT